MIQIRRNVFETNSSSTHSMTMCMKSDFDKFVKGEVYFADYYCLVKENKSQFFVFEDLMEWLLSSNNIDPDAHEEIMKMYKEHDLEGVADYLIDYDVYTWDNFGQDYETFTDSFVTPNGETVCAFGYYGENY